MIARTLKKIGLYAALAAASALLAGCSALDEMAQAIVPAPAPVPIEKDITLRQPVSNPDDISATAGPEPLAVSYGENAWRASCGAFSIDITQTFIGGSRTYIADVRVSDMAALGSAYAYDTFESKRKEPPSDIAKRQNAVFAVNGDYYAYRTDGIVVRNGKLDRNRPSREMLAVFDDGHMEIVDERKANIDALMEKGLLHTFSFGPALVKDGRAVEDFSKSNVKNSNPRTGIGQIEADHFVFVVVDGRQEDTHGMTLAEFSKVFEDLGCSLAYNLDGGASSTMIFMGEHINYPSGNLSVKAGSERVVSDILFLAEPS